MKCHLVLLAWLGVLLASHCHADLTAAKTGSIVSGLNSGTGLVKSIADMGDKSTALFKNLGKIAGFLGAAGGFISMVLVFLPNKDSAELTFMKKQFTLVNTKLDKVTSKLDNMKSLITFQNQRSVYIKSSHAILYGHKQLLAFISEVQRTPCHNKSACRRIRARIASRYVRYLNIKKHLDKVLRGTFSRTSVFGDPLLSLVSKTSKCNFAKINWFANGVLKLAFKGQQVILAYEKLMGSKHSITQSMNDWLANIYRLRTELYIVKDKCFKNMKHQLLQDIQNSDYQMKSPSNNAANRAVKSFLEKKYPWLSVVVFSYQAYGGSVHCNADAYGGLKNMPKNRNARKRNIIVGVVDKKGTYVRQKYNVLHALDGIVKTENFYKYRKDYCKLLRKVKLELKKRNVWKYVSSMSIRKNTGGLHIQADNDLQYTEETYQLPWEYTIHEDKFKGSFTIHLVLVLKSMEQANGVRCKLACKNHGTCKIYPYSSSQYCQCKPFYEGNLCEKHSNAQFAKVIDSMLAVTFKLPILSDVYFSVKDLQQFVGVGIASIQKTISNLESSIKTKINKLSRNVKFEFEWAGLEAMYSTAVHKITFYNSRFEELKKYKDNKKLEKEGRELAKTVLQLHQGIRESLFLLHHLIAGRVNSGVFRHKPLLFAYMQLKAGQPCTSKYKRNVDHYWKELLLFQQTGYMVWAQALEFAKKNSSIVSRKYSSRIAEQLNELKRGTCSKYIPYSVNVNCNKPYLHTKMTFRTRCIRNYYVSGSLYTSCNNHRSSCRKCKCDRIGSSSQQCSDISGKCKCNPGFKGKNCEDRDCVWGRWSSYGGCSCGTDGKRVRTRTINVSKKGKGEACKGKSSDTASCFIGCCANQFHCSNRRKCIPASYKCDYDNDCGDKQDERHCNEQCHTRYTSYSSDGGGRLVYLDRQHLSCRSGETLQMFHMEGSGNKLRYQYICCTLLRNICSNRMKYNQYTYAVHSSGANYLARQRVTCGETALISSFRLRRSSSGRYIRFEYNCCHMDSQRREKQISCYSSKTKWTYTFAHRSFYLARQTVRCRPRYFLNAFRLENRYGSGRNGHFRYHYRCCGVVF